MTLRPVGTTRLALDLADCRGNAVTVAADCELSEARTPQADRRRAELSRLGDTIYTLAALRDAADTLFVPASVLATLRRSGIAALDRAQAMRFARLPRAVPVAPSITLPRHISCRSNVANRVAESFYRRHGAVDIASAAECGSGKVTEPTVVMTSRYCIRRELGRCLKTAHGREWRNPLTLTSPNSSLRYALDFDCTRCRMNVIALPIKLLEK